MARYAHVDEDGGVDKRVDDIVHRLVFVELALAVVPSLPFSGEGRGMRYCKRVPGERDAGNEGRKQIIAPELFGRSCEHTTRARTRSTLTIPINPRQKKARPIPYAKKLSSVNHVRPLSAPCLCIGRVMYSPSSHRFCSANRSVFLAMYLPPPPQPLFGYAPVRAVGTHPTTTPKTTLNRTS